MVDWFNGIMVKRWISVMVKRFNRVLYDGFEVEWCSGLMV